MREYTATFRELRAAFPDFVVGFDLVGNEDYGSPLLEFLPELQQLRRDMPDVKFFFHAGETSQWSSCFNAGRSIVQCLRLPRSLPARHLLPRCCHSPPSAVAAVASGSRREAPGGILVRALARARRVPIVLEISP